MSPLLVLIVAVLATTYAGPIVRFATAPALAVAFWRLVVVLPVTGALAGGGGRGGGGAGPSPPSGGTAPRPPLPLKLLSGLRPALPFSASIAPLPFTTRAP